MSRKSIIMFAMFIGSCAGGYGATLFGADAVSFASLIGSSVGGALGIWIAFNLTR
jgi:hypothetical protein